MFDRVLKIYFQLVVIYNYKGFIFQYEIITLEKIDRYFADAGLPMFDISSVLYVMIEEDQDSFSLFDCLEALKLKHFLVYFHPNEIIIISLTGMVNLSDKLVRYPTEKIKEINIKKG